MNALSTSEKPQNSRQNQADKNAGDDWEVQVEVSRTPMNVAGQASQPAFSKAVSNQKTNRRNAQPDDHQNFSQFVQSIQDGAQDWGSQQNCFRQRENFAQNLCIQSWKNPIRPKCRRARLRDAFRQNNSRRQWRVANFRWRKRRIATKAMAKNPITTPTSSGSGMIARMSFR